MWLSFQIGDILCGDVPYFLCYGTRPSYKYINIRGGRVCIIDEGATRRKIDDRSHRGYFMGYADPTGVFIYWKPDQ